MKQIYLAGLWLGILLMATQLIFQEMAIMVQFMEQYPLRTETETKAVHSILMATAKLLFLIQIL
jgi:hypothetical protein